MRLSDLRLSTNISYKVKMDLQKVVNILNKYAPLSLASSWDNVGLLVEPPSQKTVRGILLTNDLTEEVLNESVAVKADLILSYHPPIFAALKRVTSNHWKERIIGRCLEAGIAVYSPHTAYDALPGGVNDWLVTAFGEACVSPIEKMAERPLFSHVIKCSATEDDKKQLNIMLSTMREVVNKDKILIDIPSAQIICMQSSLLECVGFLSANEFTNFQYIISKGESVDKPGYGMGRSATLTSKTTIGDVLNKLKTMTGLSHFRVGFSTGHSLGTIIKTGAVCAGSGIAILRNVHVDLVVTGEMGHHDVLEFAQTGTTVVLLEHSNSERGFLADVLQPKLSQLLGPGVPVLVSEKDRDPLQII